jgi:hypothetical protein
MTKCLMEIFEPFFLRRGVAVNNKSNDEDFFSTHKFASFARYCTYILREDDEIIIINKH